MSTPPTTGRDEASPQTGLHVASDETEDLEGLKIVVLESAELATRSANMATNAGADLKTATKNLETTLATQKKQTTILFGAAGGLMLLVAAVFVAMTISLKSKINQLDSMLDVMGKRVVELDASMELVGSVNQALQEMVSKQEGLTNMQGKLDARLDEAIKNSQSVPEQTAKQVDAKGQLIAKQVQGMDARLQQQANVLKALSTQHQNIQGAVGDTGGLKREMEALAKLQRERQTVESTANSQASAAAAAAAAAVRQREKMVQYPRVQQDATPSGSAGVLSTKP
jgi:DNA repair exonuclease SbcCD ATPase subunit